MSHSATTAEALGRVGCPAKGVEREREKETFQGLPAMSQSKRRKRGSRTMKGFRQPSALAARRWKKRVVDEARCRAVSSPEWPFLQSTRATRPPGARSKSPAKRKEGREKRKERGVKIIPDQRTHQNVHHKIETSDRAPKVTLYTAPSSEQRFNQQTCYTVYC